VIRKVLVVAGASYLGLVVLAVGMVGLSGSWVDTAWGGPCGLPTLTGSGPGRGGRPTWSERANARVILGIGKSLGVPSWAWVVAIATALQESGLEDLPYGAGSALGLFQQQPPSGWGTRAEVMDPAYAAEAFYGGRPLHGTANRGLLEVPGWQGLPLTVAAQRVQRSAYPGAYARWQPEAEALAAADASAPPVRLPLPPRTWGPLHGHGGSGDYRLMSAGGCPGISAPGKASAVVAAAEHWLGTPYSWGGGDDQGPTLGIGVGAHTVGFDCSGLVMAAYWEGAHAQLPRTSEEQYVATKARSVRLGALRPGDLVFYDPGPSGPGNVALYIGHGGVIQAPHTGGVVEIVPLWTRGFAGATRVLAGGRA
jgi:hypothetical protein